MHIILAEHFWIKTVNVILSEPPIKSDMTVVRFTTVLLTLCLIKDKSYIFFVLFLASEQQKSYTL